jgi:hypothetical protein
MRLSKSAVVFARVPTPTDPDLKVESVIENTWVPSTYPLIAVPENEIFRLCQLPAASVTCPLESCFTTLPVPPYMTVLNVQAPACVRVM